MSDNVLIRIIIRFNKLYKLYIQINKSFLHASISFPKIFRRSI